MASQNRPMMFFAAGLVCAVTWKEFIRLTLSMSCAISVHPLQACVLIDVICMYERLDSHVDFFGILHLQGLFLTPFSHFFRAILQMSELILIGDSVNQPRILPGQ